MGDSGQAATFLLTIAAGLVLGLAFDFYRVMCGIFRLRWIVMAITDLIYWLVSTAVVFFTLIAGNWGEMRFYVFIGLVTGGAVYYRFFSKMVIRFLRWLMRLVIKVLGSVKKVVLHVLIAPIVWVVRKLIKPVRRMIKRILSSYRSANDNLSK
ncbi:MAG: yabQ [Firmicutes bacterium]|nr:yabQ [Bacillota bacterium]